MESPSPASTELSVSQTSDMAMLRQFLSTFAFTEIGTIGAVVDGRAEVITSRLVNGKQVVYDDVEILYIGSNKGAMCRNCSGSLCLLFRPVTTIVDTKDMGVSLVNLPYDESGMKAIPLSNGIGTAIDVGFDDINNFGISSRDIYTLTFEPDRILFMSQSGGFVSLNSNGSVSIGTPTYQQYIGADGSYSKLFIDKDNKPIKLITIDPDGTETIKRNGTSALTVEQQEDITKYTDWTWTQTNSNDGQVSIQQKDGVAISIGSDGGIQLTVTKDLTIDAGQNNIAFSCKKFSVNDTDLTVGS